MELLVSDLQCVSQPSLEQGQKLQTFSQQQTCVLNFRLREILFCGSG